MKFLKKFFSNEKALRTAIEKSNAKMVKLLVKCKEFDVNNREILFLIYSNDKLQPALLHLAVLSDNVKIVNYILSCPNLDVNILFNELKPDKLRIICIII